MYLKEVGCEGVYSTQSPAAGSSEHGNISYGPLKRAEFR
jgi:hypothetical protein